MDDLENLCNNKSMAETERVIWRTNQDNPYNTVALNTYMEVGCYDCRGYDKRCKYYDGKDYI